MGAKTSKRSVDITTTPKKGESGDVVPGEGEGKVEKIGDLEAKVTTNGGIHSEIEYADKEETEKDQVEPIKDNGVTEIETPKTPEPTTADTTTNETLNETTETPKEKSPEPEKVDDTPESNKKTKDKSKKKKWSFRSISFSKKDKSAKPDKEPEVKETTEEEVPVASPTNEEPTEKQADAVTPTPVTVTNGDAIPEEPEKTEECKLVQPESKSEPEPLIEPPKPVEIAEPKITESKPTEVAETKPVEVEQKSTNEVVESIPVIEPVIAEEPKEVRSEEVPPPLPTSNPPSPVTVFAESTMAEVQVVCEKVVEQHTAPAITETSPVKEVEPVAQSSPVVEHKPPEVVLEAPLSPVTEQILNADSLPDISTESLPSLPDPLSETLPEPMSLPSVDCIPEPIANDTDPEPIPNIPHESEVVLTNGETNGLSSPVHNGTNDDADLTPPPIEIDRPIKQVIPVNETIQNDRQEGGDKQENLDPTLVKVEE